MSAKKWMALASAFLLFSSHSFAWAEATSYKVGIDQRAFVPPEPFDWRGASGHALKTIVWYPAEASASETDMPIGPPGAPFFDAGTAAARAKLSDSRKKYPLVFLSHGTGGSAIQMAWLGRELAARGYIAAAVDHPGNNGDAPHTLEGFSYWWERADDAKAVIDAMLSDPEFGPRIDAKRIGAAGFSLGGYTMIVLAGGITDIARYSAFCDDAGDIPACGNIAEFPGLRNQIRERKKSDPAFRAVFDGASKSRRDPHIRAVFAIAPALGPAFVPESLEHIAIPVEIAAGNADTILPIKDNAEYFAAHIPHAKLDIVDGAGHYTFLLPCEEAGKKALPLYCTDADGIERRAVQRQISQHATGFFNINLK